MSARIPRSPRMHRAIADFEKGRWEEALRGFEVARREDPTNREAFNYEARSYEALGRLEEALRSIDQALQVSASDPSDHRNRGVVLLKLGRLEEALGSFNAALSLRPDFVDVLLKRAASLDALERREEALRDAERAVLLEPASVGALHVRGRVLDHLLRYDEALADFRRMAEIEPANVEAINNIGMIQSRHGRFEEALACYDRSLELAPGVPHTLYNRSIVLLSLGDWSRGFEEYEVRWKIAPVEALRFDKLGVRWRGCEDLTGKVLLLHHEQGYGDTLLCVRYSRLLQARGARVVLAVPQALRQLMKGLSGSPEVVADGDPIPRHDYYCPCLSLPLAFGTTPDSVPADVPYLFADQHKAEKWRGRLEESTRARIGIVWSGRQFAPINYPRDVPLDTLRTLFELEADFFTLQPDVPERDAAVLQSTPNLKHSGAELEDFSDTAGLIHNLDLVIAADTAVAHLAGALGKPVWLMNRFSPCWRWLRDRDDSPWYPTLMQFRQTSLGDWAGVAARLRSALESHLQDPSRRRADESGPQATQTGRGALRPFVASLVAPAAGARTTREDFEHAFVAHQKGRIEDAIAGYRRVLRTLPSHPHAVHYLGVGLAQRGELDEAGALLDRATALKPDDPLAHVHYGNVLRSLSRCEQALDSYERAIELDRHCVDAHYNQGAVLNALERPEAALGSFDNALAIDARHAEALNGRGIALTALGRDVEALDNYDRALALNPGLSEARWNKSLILLRAGDFVEGWRFHSACPEFQSPKSLRRFPGKRPWDGGEGVGGKSVLLHADQGFGDVIQYCRYAPLLRARGARVIVEAPAALYSLLQSLDGVDTLVMRSDGLPPAFDLQCPLSNLPGALRTDLASIPRSVPYLAASPDRRYRWGSELGQRRGLRVGLAWSGNPNHRQDSHRSIPIELIASLKGCGVEFVSLQREVRDSDAHFVAALCQRHFGAELKDFEDTAAVISHLDLVISVDTAVAHLAGALGKRVWILLPVVPDWRWMKERRDSPWYPTARLFRQNVRGRWPEVIEAVQHELWSLKESARLGIAVSTLRVSGRQPPPQRPPTSSAS